MAYSLLSLVQQVTGEMGLAQPAIVIGTANNQTAQFLALAQRLGKDLMREYSWQRLVKAYRFSTTAALTYTGTTTSGSTTVTALSGTTSLAAGLVMSGTGIAAYTEVNSVNAGASTLVMDTPATASGTVTLTFAYQDYAPPSDFDRMVPDTQWDRTDHWRNIGTKSSQEWQTLQGGVISVGPRERYRIYNGNLRIFPALTTVFNFGFEYVSNAWVIAMGGTAGTKAAFTLDTDLFIYPDDLMLAGLKMYFLKAKKLDFGAELSEFARALATCKAQDVPVPAMSLSPVEFEPLVGPWSVQDGNWPTTSS